MFSCRNKKKINTFGLKKQQHLIENDVELNSDWVLHHSVLYIFWSFVIIEPILGFLKLFMRVTDEAEFTQKWLAGPLG